MRLEVWCWLGLWGDGDTSASLPELLSVRGRREERRPSEAEASDEADRSRLESLQTRY